MTSFALLLIQKMAVSSGNSPLFVVGETRPFWMGDDDIVSGALIVAFVCMALVFVANGVFVVSRIAAFFRNHNRSGFAAFPPDVAFEGKGLLLLALAVLWGALLYYLLGAAWAQTNVLAAVPAQQLPQWAQTALAWCVGVWQSPYFLLGLGTVAALLYYLLKLWLYRLVNNVFFAPDVADDWQGFYLLHLFVMAVLLLPIALGAVYSNMPPKLVFYLTFGIVIFAKISLFYKQFHVFSVVKISFFHLLLYFCTLEILPLLLLYKALRPAN